MELSNWEKWKRSLIFGLKIFTVLMILYLTFALSAYHFNFTKLYESFIERHYRVIITLILNFGTPLILSKRLMYTKYPKTVFLLPLGVLVHLSYWIIDGSDVGLAGGFIFYSILAWTALVFLLVAATYFLHKKFEH